MSERRLTDFSTLAFDCYGTLIDWETGVWDALRPLLAEPGRDAVARRDALAAFAELESARQASAPDMPYPEVLTRVHAGLARRFGLPTDAGMDAAFGASTPRWPAFPDTVGALRLLARHFRLVVLSNVDAAGFAASNRKLGVAFDAVYTAQDIGSYKPDPRNFDYMLERLAADFRVAAGDVLHTAQSLFHDHVPARRAGLANAWIDRRGLSQGGDWGATARVAERPRVDFLFPSLGAMAEAAAAEIEGARTPPHAVEDEP